MMKRQNKALLYMALAALPGLTEAAAVWANRKLWPDQFEIVALSLATLTQILLALKAYYSDPSKDKESK